MNQNNIKPQELMATDLRIGNWVTLSGTMPMIIYEIHEDCFYAKDEKNSSFKNTWADIQPIPLSDEVLLKCGFEKYQWQNAMYIKTVFGHLYLHFYKDRIITSFKNITYDHEGQKMKSLGFIGHKESVENIIYLHQLQNLFYSLTQSELETNFF